MRETTSRAPSYCNSKWVEAAKRDNAFTRVARPEGKGVDSQEGENRRCSPSCAQCGRAGRAPARWERAQTLLLSKQTLMEWRAEVVAPYEKSTAAQAAFPPAMHGHRRCAFQDEYPRRTSQVQSLTRTSPSAPDGAATSPQRGGRMGGADGISSAHARDSSLRAAPSAQNDRGAEAGWVVQAASVVTRKRGILRCGLRPPLRMTKYCTEKHALFCHPAVTALPPVILRSAATKDLALARYHISMGQSLRFGL